MTKFPLDLLFFCSFYDSLFFILSLSSVGEVYPKSAGGRWSRRAFPGPLAGRPMWRSHTVSGIMKHVSPSTCCFNTTVLSSSTFPPHLLFTWDVFPIADSGVSVYPVCTVTLVNNRRIYYGVKNSFFSG